MSSEQQEAAGAATAVTLPIFVTGATFVWTVGEIYIAVSHRRHGLAHIQPPVCSTFNFCSGK